MDSAGRHHEEIPSHNDLYPTKLTTESGSSKDKTSQDMQQLAEDLRDCDWEQLEEKYAKAMEGHGTTEEELRAQTAKLLEVNDLQLQSQKYISDCSAAGLCSLVPNHCHTRREQGFKKVRQRTSLSMLYWRIR